ncbi:hypothetical protein DFH09DRAFT_1072921 [Mycena vulgaris]|nr:hypothetical protein DFH09DRAFT_1072921 [Mycena vulgaris]
MSALGHSSSAAITPQPSRGHISATPSQKERRKVLHRLSAQIPEAGFLGLQIYWDRTRRSSGLIAAISIPHTFGEEDRRLRAERAALQAQVFECISCRENCPEDDATHISGCTHRFCRDSMRDYVVSKLTEKAFPTFCPACVGDNDRIKPGFITNDLIRTLDITQIQYEELYKPQFTAAYTFLECLETRTGRNTRRPRFSSVHLCSAITFGARKDGSTVQCPPPCSTHVCYSCGDLITSTTPPIESSICQMFDGERS